MLNVAKLEGPELDKWVGAALGKPWRKPTHGKCCTCPRCGWDNDDCQCDYSTEWAWGGPLIEREKINLQYFFKRHENDHRHEAWSAWSKDGTTEIEGPTALIAAMRCFVASKFGATFDSDTTIPGTLSEGGTVK